MLRPVAPGGRCYQCTHLTLPPVWELPLLPPQPIHFPSFSCYIMLPLSTPRLSPSLHILFFIVPPFCVCACTVCPGQWKALFLLFEVGEGGAPSKKRVISQACVPGPTTALALLFPLILQRVVHKIHCLFPSPLFLFFFPALPVYVRKWTPAVVAHRAVCVWHALGKQDTQCMPRQIKKKSRGGSSSFKKRLSVLSHSWPAWPTLFLLHLAKFLK